ncbi:hypothetical protein K461DRAFT_296339 [Myriangium duriaei CBS 260.36]|uniref:Protein kinase domain-containing protein n=1 Tax=Myriangium duriaei CBS 260.36 TaxID=1168546 RepID=A0A9P4IY15_9PEZI|nr:hypothetical protein K461DRAFT_296339 [Myriangium duriaei CBS 260.36]
MSPWPGLKDVYIAAMEVGSCRFAPNIGEVNLAANKLLHLTLQARADFETFRVPFRRLVQKMLQENERDRPSANQAFDIMKQSVTISNLLPTTTASSMEQVADPTPSSIAPYLCEEATHQIEQANVVDDYNSMTEGLDIIPQPLLLKPSLISMSPEADESEVVTLSNEIGPLPRPGQEITSPANENHIRDSTPGELDGLASPSAEFDEQHTKPYVIRARYTGDLWSRPHEAPPWPTRSVEREWEDIFVFFGLFKFFVWFNGL